MALPKKLERLVAKIKTQSPIEAELLPVFTKRLARNLHLLRDVVDDSCPEKLYGHMIDCIATDAHTDCLDWYEKNMERCLFNTLRRPLSEIEEQLVSEVIDEIVNVTEILLLMAGVRLAEPEEPEDEPEEAPRRR